MRITFVLPAANLGGGARVIAMYAEHLRRRGHQILVVSTKKKVPHLLDRIKLFIKGYGWWPSDPGPSHFDGLELEHRVINRFRPVTDSDMPDADVVVATWWETAEWVAQLSPAKGAKRSSSSRWKRISYTSRLIVLSQPGTRRCRKSSSHSG